MHQGWTRGGAARLRQQALRARPPSVAEGDALSVPSPSNLRSAGASADTVQGCWLLFVARAALPATC